jgi:hypothetical protein
MTKGLGDDRVGTAELQSGVMLPPNSHDEAPLRKESRGSPSAEGRVFWEREEIVRFGKAGRYAVVRYRQVRTRPVASGLKRKPGRALGVCVANNNATNFLPSTRSRSMSSRRCNAPGWAPRAGSWLTPVIAARGSAATFSARCLAGEKKAMQTAKSRRAGLVPWMGLTRATIAARDRLRAPCARRRRPARGRGGRTGTPSQH